MKFTMRRNRVVAGLGHAIEFEKDVPTYVPPELRKLVYESGGEPHDGAEMPDDEPKKDPGEPTDPDERREQLIEAVSTLVEAGNRDDFTAGGAPHIKAITGLLGWQPSAQERDEAWLAFQAEK